MCKHHNIVLDEYGTSTCADCSIHFEKSLCSEFTTNHNGPTLFKKKSAIISTLEKEFGINDYETASITEKIFNLTTHSKMVKGINKRSILCASLFYAYHYLETPKNFEDLLLKFNIDRKSGSKGLRLCQIAVQESSNHEEIQKFKVKIHSFVSTHKEKLKELIKRYNISLKNYDEIERIIIVGHLKKNKILTSRINNLWISCIYFWLLKINPYIDPEEFVSINSDYNTTINRLKSDLTYLKEINI